MAIRPNPFSTILDFRDQFIQIAENYVGSESAKDVFQNCFLKLLKKKNAEKMPAQYFVQMIKNEAISFLRKGKRNYSPRTNAELDAEAEDLPKCSLEDSELKQAAITFRSELTELQNTLLEKHINDGLSLSEMAKTMGNLTPQGLRYHFKRMCAAGRIRFRDWKDC